MKVGDKVRFLNDVGEGTIAEIGDRGIVYVLEKDGFETPVLAKELVVIEETNELNFTSSTTTNAKTIEEESKKTSSPATYSFDVSEETPEGEKIDLFLAFEPIDIKSLQRSPMNLFLVNDSNYYLDYLLFTGEEETSLSLYNKETIDPQTRFFVSQVKKEDVNNFNFIRFQGIAYKKGVDFQPKNTIDINFRVNPVDFFKLHKFKSNDFFEDKVMALNILINDYPPIDTLIDGESIEQALQQKKFQRTKKVFALPRKKEIIEVDLHINQLVDNTNNMSNKDMLTLQIDKFNSVMQQNLKNKGQKIVFIHGKGNGVLRKELEELLKRKYKKVSFQDASFQQYGFGATQVTIH